MKKIFLLLTFLFFLNIHSLEQTISESNKLNEKADQKKEVNNLLEDAEENIILDNELKDNKSKYLIELEDNFDLKKNTFENKIAEDDYSSNVENKIIPNTIKEFFIKFFEIDENEDISEIYLNEVNLINKINSYKNLIYSKKLLDRLKKDVFLCFQNKNLESIRINSNNNEDETKNLEVFLYLKKEIKIEEIAIHDKEKLNYLEIKENIDCLVDTQRLNKILITCDFNKKFNSDNIFIDETIYNSLKLKKELTYYLNKLLDQRTKKEILKKTHMFLIKQNYVISYFNVENFNNRKALKIVILKKDLSTINDLKKIYNQEDIILNDVTSLIFTTNPNLSKPDMLLDSYGIAVDGIKINNRYLFSQHMQEFLLKPLTLNSLKEIKEKTLKYFKKHTPYLVDVKILENQDITCGRIQILLIFAKLEEISASGAQYFSNKKILNNLNIKSDEYINLKKINSFLTYQNKNPFRNVFLYYEPAEEFGYTDIRIITKDIFPIKIYGGYQNNAYSIAGYSRYLTGFNIGNVLNLDHQLNFEFKTADPMYRWWGVVANYTMPLFFKNYLKFTGSFVKTQPNIRPVNLTISTTEGFKSKGKAFSILGRYYMPIKSFYKGNQEFILGYDFKETNNFVSYDKQILTNEKIDISQFVVGLQGIVNDNYGATNYLLNIYISPGKIGKYNKSKNFQAEQYAKSASYSYMNFHLDRITNFKYLDWIIDVSCQIASTKLIPTEQFVIGGHETIRGYQENAVFSDQGFYLKNELRSKKYFINKIKALDQNIQLLAFLDFGAAFEQNSNLFSKNAQSLASIGPGLRYSAKENIRFSLDYGMQLKNYQRAFFKKPFHSMFHVYGSLQF
jgi:hemolysin activation/secretion protein